MRRCSRVTIFFNLSFALLLAACQPSSTAVRATSAPATQGAATSAPVTPPPPTSIGTGAKVLRLATTAGATESGLLDAILPDFSNKYSARVDVLVAGIGQVLAIGANGGADVVLVPAGPDEQTFLAASDGINALDVMVDDYIIVGPKGDPASIRNMGPGADGFTMINELPGPFVSRGDQSDTNLRELSIWATALVTKTTGTAWYQTTGKGMAETLAVANQKPAYAFTDRFTWLAQKANLPNLEILVGGATVADNKDPQLQNAFTVIPINTSKYPKVNFDLATKFANWIASVDEQQVISDFGRAKFGQPLFVSTSAAWKAAHP